MNQPIRRVRPSEIDPHQLRLYQQAIWIAVLGNVTLVLAKGAATWLSGSTALLATTVDSATDLVYTLFMAWGLSRSQQPADENHPQGHARIEPVVSTVIALMMGLAGLEVVRRAIDTLRGEPATFGWGLPVAVLIGSGLVKVIMYLAVRRLAQEARSPAIMASARDNLVDVISAGTALAGVVAATWIHPLADPLAGLAVSVWIFRNAADILVENLGYLTGRAADPELVERIYAAASQVEGVEGVHRVIADYVGPQVRAELHVEVDGDIAFHDAHRISNTVRDAVQALDEVDLAFIHLEPAR
ncbi:MAG: cation diffusion facilitator family transporter [Anaerolineae bacterium]|nr:cation diffusion facilitator family transporter [Anaerolineae bacterium]